ncbi:sugar ABC transporter permease [Arthrobacter sp. SLBN-112]|uniref:carbohydrate ABC transporter permease n=1 Tax=Arthrobacter sp. SLBN-112 TaxID=2768452 RepID=UPI0027B2DB9E|nr:sugar ABC transporter permease [Arthrobacter sp. SLBN-112]MDQ0802140.1 raffinose/stachyose/melibiose transport system permease protein [Arthrobacter sp. SLBN-112]
MTSAPASVRPAVAGSARAALVRPDRTAAPSWRNIIWLIPALAVLAVFVYWPLLQNVAFSFLKWNIYSGSQSFVGADNYVELASDPVFLKALANNTWYAAISIVCQVFGALLLAAIVESVRSERMRRAFRSIYFIPSAISLTVAGLLFYFIYQPQSGLLNAFLANLGLGQYAQAWLGHENTSIFAVAAMSQWQGFGYSVLLFSVALQRIPVELYEAAAIDGIGPVRQFFSISMPLVREMTGLMMIVTVSGAFQVFNEVMVMTSGGPNNSSQVLGTWLYHAGFVTNNFGYASAIGVAVFLITLALAALQLWVSRKRRVEW